MGGKEKKRVPKRKKSAIIDNEYRRDTRFGKGDLVMTIEVNAMGDACPIPVVKTQKAMQELGGPGVIETLVDNETAVQNLGKLAASRGCASKSEKLGERQYRVTITVGENAKADEAGECFTCGKPKTVAVISSDKMGGGSDELGGALMKAFVYALSQQETLPDTILCYNGGVKLTCEGSESLEDLKGMAARGVEILSCGTCLNFYDLKEKLAVGEVTNMYVIVEKMSGADRVVRP